MKKTTKKSTRKASHRKAVKDLGVKPAKGRTVRGGVDHGDFAITKLLDAATPKLHEA